MFLYTMIHFSIEMILEEIIDNLEKTETFTITRQDQTPELENEVQLLKEENQMQV